MLSQTLWLLFLCCLPSLALIDKQWPAAQHTAQHSSAQLSTAEPGAATMGPRPCNSSGLAWSWAL